MHFLKNHKFNSISHQISTISNHKLLTNENFLNFFPALNYTSTFIHTFHHRRQSIIMSSISFEKQFSLGMKTKKNSFRVHKLNTDDF